MKQDLLDPILLRHAIDYSDNSIVSKSLLKNDLMTITLFSFDAGQALSEHTAPFDALVQCIDGEIELLVGGKERKLNNGEIILMPANVPHAVTAQTKFKMLLIMVKNQI